MSVETRQRRPQLNWQVGHPDDLLLERLLRRDQALERRVDEVRHGLRALKIAAPHLGEAPLFMGHRRCAGEPNDWVLVNAAVDPLVHGAGGLPVPRTILTELKLLERQGPRFDALYLAHEIAPGSLDDGEPLRRRHLAPPPAATALRTAGLLGRLGQVAWAAALAPIAAVGLAGLIAAAPSTALAGLDPVLLGAVVAPGHAIAEGAWAAWFLIARWGYNMPEGDYDDT